MATPKGYTSQEKEDRLTAQHVTISPSGEFKHALDVRNTATVTSVASDSAEAGSTDSQITATSHSAKKGDRIRFTSGTHDTVEADVIEVDTNTITLGQTLDSDISAGDNFDILRPISQTLSSTGGSTSVATFVRDGSNQEVTEDTSTPANNRPLPVKLTGLDGDVRIESSNLDLHVQMEHDGANPDSVQIGDGTETVSINASNEMEVSDSTAQSSLSTIAGDTTSLDSKVTTCDTSNVTVSSPLPAGTNNIGDVDVLSQPARDHTTDSIQIGDGTETVNVNASNEMQVADDTARTSLSTIAGDTTSLDSKVTTCDTSNVTVSSPLPAGTNNIGDVDVVSQPARAHGTDSIRLGDGTDLTEVTAAGELTVSDSTAQSSLSSIDTDTSTIAGDTTSLDSKVTACDTGNVTISSALPAGTNNIGDVDIASSLPAGTNTIGNVNLNYLDVVDFIDGDIVDASSTNIPGSGGSQLELVASLASDVKKIQPFDTTGGFLGIYTGAAASEVLQVVVGPGSDQTVEVNMTSGERVSVKRLDSTTALNTGFLAINFLG